MTAAFILGISLFIAGVFAVVAATNRNATGARWIAVGCTVGMVHILLEYVMPWQSHPAPVETAVFLSYLLTINLCFVGVARHYSIDPPRRIIAAIWLWAVMSVPLMLTIDYASPARVALYQLPHFMLQAVLLFSVLRVKQLYRLDLALAGAFVGALVIYAARPLIAWQVGISAMPQGYLASQYAAISQSLAAGMLVAQALVMLLVMMRDRTAEILARSETDSLSGLFNRRGFQDYGDRAIAVARARGEPVALIAADLDQFKAINDQFGHAAGDAVIAHFAQILKAATLEAAIVSRTGGEEFVVLLSGANLGAARQYAEGIRRNFAAADLSAVGVSCPVSASFGVAQLTHEETLCEIWRRADVAMYRAKAEGRNQVRLAMSESPAGSVTAMSGAA